MRKGIAWKINLFRFEDMTDIIVNFGQSNLYTNMCRFCFAGDKNKTFI